MGDLILIGLPASGKTTVGRQLARRLDMPFFDCDEAIGAAAGCSVSDIFARYGESYFRQLEHRTLEELCRKESCVIATGGGVVKRQSNVVKLHASGLIIFIDRRAEDIVTDVEVEKRPLLKEGPDKVFTLYKERIALYRAAADRILENRGSEKEVLSRLLDMVKE